MPISNTKYDRFILQTLFDFKKKFKNDFYFTFSLLQRKLKESHQNFDKHVVDFCAKTADGLSKEMKRVAQNIGTAQSSVQVLFNSILRSQFDINFI